MTSTTQPTSPQAQAEFLEQARQRFSDAMRADELENSQKTNLWHNFKDWLLTSSVEKEVIASSQAEVELKKAVAEQIPVWIDSHITTLLQQEGPRAQPLLDLQSRLNESLENQRITGRISQQVTWLVEDLQATASQCSSTTNAIAWDASAKIKISSSLSKTKSKEALEGASSRANGVLKTCEASAALAFEQPEVALQLLRDARFDPDVGLDIFSLAQAKFDLNASADSLAPVVAQAEASHARFKTASEALQAEFAPQAAPYRAKALALVPASVLELLPEEERSVPGIELPPLLDLRNARLAAQATQPSRTPTVTGRSASFG